MSSAYAGTVEFDWTKRDARQALQSRSKILKTIHDNAEQIESEQKSEEQQSQIDSGTLSERNTEFILLKQSFQIATLISLPRSNPIRAQSEFSALKKPFRRNADYSA